MLLHSLAMPSEAYRLPSAPPFIAPLYFVTWHCTALGHLVTWHCTALGHLWSRGTALRWVTCGHVALHCAGSPGPWRMCLQVHVNSPSA